MKANPILVMSSAFFCLLLCSTPLFAQADAGDQDKPETRPTHLEHRNYDRRADTGEQATTTPSPGQLEALDSFAATLEDLAVTFDQATGATRAIYNRGGYLTSSNADADPVSLAINFVESNLGLLGLHQADLADIEVRDNVFSALSGATHIYFGQQHQGLPVYNAQLHVNVNREGRLISVNNSFMPAAAESANGLENAVKAGPAVLAAAAHLGVPFNDFPRAGEQSGNEPVQVIAPRLSQQPIIAKLMWLPVAKNELRLIWNFQIYTNDNNHVYDMNVDAQDARVWTRFDWVASEDYRVFAQPIESPNFASPPPPADARTVEIDSYHPDASPFGWHDTDGIAGAEHSITRGNNVHAYDDSSNNNSPNPAVPEPDGGVALSFDEPMDFSMEPTTYRDAATVELFYWNNIIHDVLYLYGFDEEGGNFQANNYGHGGLGNDDVRAESQDGSGTNNANFFTPADGSRPRMQMYRFTITSPGRDGDFDHGIVIHEYGHGISNRLVGGPSNVSCLNNTQQPGEGISDWYWLALTHQPGITGATTRGAGTYVLGQPVDGPGVRPQPYSTDPGVNSYTYESINSGISVPHGVGSVWANAAYEVYWALVEARGFDENIYDAMGTSGNQRALFYFTEGLKNTACGTDYLGYRDGVVQAATDNFGGEDVCTVWSAFANFGLGTDATSNGPNSLTVSNGFSTPVSCSCIVPAAPTNLAANCDFGDAALTWDGSAERYNVYRADGACAGGSYTLLATGISDTRYTDTTTSVGSTYSYVVRGTPDSGLCESSNSNCSDVSLACDTQVSMALSWGSCFNVLNLINCLKAGF